MPQDATSASAPDSSANPSPVTPSAASATPPVPPTAPTLDDAMASVDFTQMSDSQIAALESGDREMIRKVFNIEDSSAGAAALPVPEEKEDAAQGTVRTTEDKGTAQGSVRTTTEAGATDPNDRGPDRISLKAIQDPDERRAVADAARFVREGKYPNLKAALIAVLKLDAAAAPASEKKDGEEATNTEGARPPPLLASDPTVTEIETKIANLQSQRKTAKEQFDYDKAEELLEQISDLKLDLREAKRAATERATQQQSWKRQEETSRAAAITQFAELDDPESAFSRLVEDEIILANHRQDSIFDAPDWPEKIAIRVNEKHGKRFGSGGGKAEPGQQQQATPPPQIPQLPPKGVRLPGSPVGPGANTTAVTAATALAELDTLPLEDQDAVLAALDIAEQQRRRRGQ